MSKGNTLPGGEETERIVVQVPARLKRQYQDAIDKPMSKDLRAHIRQTVDIDESELAVPEDDDDLAKAYKLLVKNKNAKTGNIRIRRAKSIVSQRIGEAEDDLNAFVFGPLQRRGYISMRYGAPGKGGNQGVIEVREHYAES